VLFLSIFAFQNCSPTNEGAGVPPTSTAPPSTESPNTEPPNTEPPNTEPPSTEQSVSIDLTGDFARFVDGSGQTDDYTSKRVWCESLGWTKLVVDTSVGKNTIKRKVLHKGPSTPWVGTILVFHGGGGNYTNWCTTNSKQSPWGGFTETALARGYGVILMDSTDITTDSKSNLCGKIWDDNILNRHNHDLPYIEKAIKEVAPSLRPSGSSNRIYLTGFSSGGFMTTRAATHFNHLVTKFAPAGSASPYGWHRDCSQLSTRPTVAGEGKDNDSNQAITTVGGCGSYVFDINKDYPGELTWDDGGASTKPKFLKLEHYYDGINDYSCHNRVLNRLLNNNYVGTQFVMEPAGETRRIKFHDWFPEFTTAILDFFDAT
jgi:dienelactone hydrolase